MNTPQSDETDSTIDIFVLSVHETVVPLLPENLEKKGYKVTLFTDGKNLLEALKPEKPDLLICDTTSLDREAFEVCRRIKADENLGMIPVLVLTNVSMISDLFNILDCNADNFLPVPFDLPFGLSVIESMLWTPIERQIPDQIKTQFKVRHDDHTYVVAASRRKLLELLLSSFEIVVATSSELSHVKTDLQTLAETGQYLEDRFNDQTRLIDTIQTTLHQKEQKILSLTSELEEKQKLLAQKTRKAFIVTDDENSQTAFLDNKGPGISSFSEITMLRQQIAELVHEVDTTRTSLDTVQMDLEEEKMHCTSLECTLELLDQQKELAMQAKTQSEQELSQIIEDLNKKNEDQAADLIRLRSELEQEVSRRISAENQAGSLSLEKEKPVSLVRPVEDGLINHPDDLQLQLETTRAALENEKRTTKLLNEHLAEIVSEHKKTELRVKEELESDKATVIRLKHDLDDATAIQNTLRCDIDDLTSQNRAIVEELNRAHQGRTQSDQQVSLLTGELNKLQTAFDNERRLHEEHEKRTTKLLNEHLAEIVAEHKKTELRVKEELESDKATVIRLKHDLDDATAIQNTLRCDIDDLTSQNRAIVEELNRANQGRTQSDQQVSLLTGELNKLQTAFDNERTLHEEHEKRIETLMHTLQLTEHELLTSVEEKKTLEEYLENERKLRETAEDTSRAAGEDLHHLEQELRAVTDQQVRKENDLCIRSKNLEEELARVRNQNNSLRKQVNVLTNERILAEQKVNNLPDEFDQARTAIGEEGSDHPTQDGSYDSFGEKFPARKQVFSIEETPAIIKEHNQDVIVEKAHFPCMGKSSSPVFGGTLPNEQRSPDPEKELISSKPSSPVPEVSGKTVNEIMNSFRDDDLFEEN